ncbi:unnamed protein product [Calypogeia fissa]
MEARGKTLPEHLVEKIVSMMPFPEILKARSLSKSWRRRFSPVSSQDDEDNKRVATEFQKLVREQSTKWSTGFFRVFIDKGFISIYDRQCGRRCVRLPTPYFLRQKFRTSRASELFVLSIGKTWTEYSPLELPFLRIEGDLLYCFEANKGYVANILTLNWKQLPNRPNVSMDRNETTLRCITHQHPIVVRNPSSDTYKVIVLHGYGDRGDVFNRWYAQIYESTTGCWSTKKLVAEGQPPSSDLLESLGCPVYFNGVLFVGSDDRIADHNIYLVAINLEKGTFKGLKFSFDGLAGWVIRVHLVICNARLMMAVLNSWVLVGHVFTVDLESRELLEVAQVPPVPLQTGNQPCCVGNCIFFSTDIKGQMLRYDVQQDKWDTSDFPTTRIPASTSGPPFRLGLNPFCGNLDSMFQFH